MPAHRSPWHQEQPPGYQNAIIPWHQDIKIPRHHGSMTPKYLDSFAREALQALNERISPAAGALKIHHFGTMAPKCRYITKT